MPAVVQAQAPLAPTVEEAEIATRRYGGFAHHRFPTCFVSGTAHEPRAGGLAERDPEPQPRDSAGERLVQILDRLDEVRLAEDQVQLLGLLDRDDVQLDLGRPVSFIRAPRLARTARR